MGKTRKGSKITAKTTEKTREKGSIGTKIIGKKRKKQKKNDVEEWKQQQENTEKEGRRDN